MAEQSKANVLVRHAVEFGGGNRATLAAQHALGHVAIHGGEDAFFAPFSSNFLGAEIAALPVFNQEGGLALTKFDVGTATGHVGGDHHCAEFASTCHDFCFALMLLGVEHFVVNAVLLLEFAAQVLALLNAGGANQHRTASVMEALDLINNRVPLVLLTQEHQVITVAADHGLVGWNTDYAKLVDFIKLSGFGVSGTSHAREALVKLEEILDGDGGHRLRLFLNRDAFLRFNGLMQTVGPLPTHHLATGVLVNNDDGLLSLIIRSHHVIAVALIDGVSAHGLFKKVGHVHVLAHVETTDLGFALCFGDAFVGQCGALLVELHFVVLHTLVADLLEFAEFGLCGLECFAERWLGGTVARVTNLAFDVRGLGLRNLHLFVGGFPRGLLAHKVLGKAVRHFVARLDGVGHAANDERRARFVNQDGVDFIDDGKLTASLYLVFRARLHIVAQVIEAKLGGGSVDHVAGVRLALSFVTLHMHGMDGANRQAKRAEERERPVAVALHQVIVHGDHVHLHLLKACQVASKRADDGLTFAGLHFGDLAFTENDAADDLHVKRTRAERRATLWVQVAHGLVQGRVKVNKHPAWSWLGAAAERAGWLGVGGGGDAGAGIFIESARRGGQALRVEAHVLWHSWVEDVANANGAVHGFARDGKDFRSQVEGLLALGNAGAELIGHGHELRIGEGAHAVLLLIHQVHLLEVPLDHALVLRAQGAADDPIENGDTFEELAA